MSYTLLIQSTLYFSVFSQWFLDCNRKANVSPFLPFRIASGAYYEAHQQLRVIAARYIKQSNYDAAADILAGGATALLRAGSQQGASASGGDLAIMLVVEVYNKAGWEIADGDTDGKARKSEFLKSGFCFLALKKMAFGLPKAKPPSITPGIEIHVPMQ